ncbi:MAG: site-specific integrase [Syntrophus sp. (in: bacteria)]
MPSLKRHKTKYPGVFFIEVDGPMGSEKIYYIRYRLHGKPVEEKAGCQYRDDMTPSRASGRRADRIAGKEPTNSEKRELEQAAKEAESQIKTISDIWIHYKASKTLKGIVQDEHRFEKYVKPKLGNKEPSEIVPLDIQRVELKLKKSKKSPGSIRNVIELVRRLINYGVKMRLCKGPDFNIELPKANTEKMEDLSPGELASLLTAIEQDDHILAGNMMRLALYSGMRRGEMFKLKWSDINFDKGAIALRDPKGGKDQIIPLNDASRQLLDGHPKTKSVYVFPGRGGKQRVDINKAVGKIKKSAGLPEDFRALHGLRHVYASMLASSGKVDMYTLQKLMTHKSAAMTQRYAALRDDTLRKASNLTQGLIEDELAKAKENQSNSPE